MPLLRFTEQRFHPDLSFPVCFLVGFGLAVPSHTVKILLKKAAAKRPPFLAACTFCLECTDIAPRRISSIVVGLVHVVVPIPAQDRASWTCVVVGLGIIREGFTAKQGCALV